MFQKWMAEMPVQAYPLATASRSVSSKGVGTVSSNRYFSGICNNTEVCLSKRISLVKSKRRVRGVAGRGGGGGLRVRRGGSRPCPCPFRGPK